jgi:hypothetical protein
MMVRDFNAIVGRECVEQMPRDGGRQPDAVLACVGGGSNAMGIFHAYIPHERVRLIGVEAGGLGIETGKHAASLSAGSPGVLHGNRTYLMQDADGQIQDTHSISAGLDYPGVGPSTRGSRTRAAPSTSPSPTTRRWPPSTALPPRGHHPGARVEPRRRARDQHRAHHGADRILLVNLSGRGDKDMHTVARLPGCSSSSTAMIESRPPSRSAERTASALIPFVTAATRRRADGSGDAWLVAGGADVIELGMPFSDPDGRRPVIQRSPSARSPLGDAARRARYVAEFRRKTLRRRSC